MKFPVKELIYATTAVYLNKLPTDHKIHAKFNYWSYFIFIFHLYTVHAQCLSK
jgi:hypothetical protein